MRCKTMGSPGTPGRELTERTTMQTEIHATRQLTPADRRQLDDMLNRAFADDEIGRQYYWADNDWNLWLRSEGEIVSHVGVVDRIVTVGGQPIRVGGVGAVATAQAWRRRGYAQQLMEATGVLLRDELRVRAGLLICGEEMVPYYGRLGWQTVPGPLLIDQPQGKVVVPATIMVLLFDETPWPAGTIDLCGLPF
jgi:predicted N-acetyltransferase YhbS